ncbi:MAG TPA: FAD-dependent monooxygenase [Methyloceanibacter sp.]|nr:FAD-dependent monooxygenase [Methyloceanibacter sp.]
MAASPHGVFLKRRGKESDVSAQPIRDVVVVGLGPSGLVTALALAEVGANVAAIGAPSPANGPSRETRTAALLASSVDLLKSLGVWQTILPHAAPLEAIRIIDASQSLIRAPEIEFRAEEIGLPAFGYNVANTVLTDTLHARAKAVLPAIVAAKVNKVAFEPDRAVLSLSNGEEIAARLVAGADGRNSICRKSAGIGVTERLYDQAALAASFSHARPHESVSTELHREGGSVTTVPLPDPHASSLIWVGSPAEIERLMQLDAPDFSTALSERLAGVLGEISETGPRADFKVAGLVADRLGAKRVVLIGEAAHILPPIGAQGLNLGFRDAASLADCVAGALGKQRDPGDHETIDAYIGARRLDVITRSLGVDLMSRSLLTSLPPLQAARGLVMQGLKALPPLRRAVMRVGLTPPTELPRLMRGERD